jgi:hypothetical protein
MRAAAVADKPGHADDRGGGHDGEPEDDDQGIL